MPRKSKTSQGLVRYRSGTPGQDAKKFIRENITSMSLERIAEQVRFSPETVRKTAIKMGIMREEGPASIIKTPENVDSETRLKASPYWGILQKEFSELELDYFLYQYGKYIDQFDRDVMPSEETQIMQAIKLELLMQRNLSATKETTVILMDLRDRQSLLNQIVKEKRVKKEDVTETVNQLAQLETIITNSQNGQTARAKDLLALQHSHSQLLEELKATRQQRISKIENSKKNFIGIIKALEDEDFKMREGRELELFKLAEEKEYKRLAKLHTYMNGDVDQILLTPETVEMWEKKDI